MKRAPLGHRRRLRHSEGSARLAWAAADRAGNKQLGNFLGASIATCDAAPLHDEKG
jgi:hypothetical protein